MELVISVKEWKIITKDDKSKTIAGEYAVTCGPNEVAKSNFNNGYDSTDIQIPTDLLAEAEILDTKIKQTISAHFTGIKES
ncbi:MAG TPA: hypothetical protein ENI23_16305 [bacterium]|nr:hypothetical protein [bacterium]